jgi:hypothetical protein
MLNTKSITANLQLEKQQRGRVWSKSAWDHPMFSQPSTTVTNHDNTYRESTITTAAALSTTTASSPTAAAAARYLN